MMYEDLKRKAKLLKGVSWYSYPTGLMPERMRTFSFIHSHNRTPHVMNDVAEYIEAARPGVVLDLVERLEKYEQALRHIRHMPFIENARGLAEETLAQQAMGPEEK